MRTPDGGRIIGSLFNDTKFYCYESWECGMIQILCCKYKMGFMGR